MKPTICLGTVQFGQPYGITNTSGQVPEEEVGRILDKAQQVGITYLDTAQAYGNAEAVIGRQLPNSHKFRLISKLAAQSKSEFSSNDMDVWEKNFSESCHRLGTKTLDSYLLHAPSDLRKPGGYLLENWLLSLRERGLVNRLGVSIYAAEDLEYINPTLLDLVQLPLSLYDQRMIRNGTINRLEKQGTKIHIRSVYLQGLLLTPANKWPLWVPFDARVRQQKLEELAKQRDCDLNELVLGFAQSLTNIEAVVLGVCSLEELTAMIMAWRKRIKWSANEYNPWALQNSAIIDPRKWPT